MASNTKIRKRLENYKKDKNKLNVLKVELKSIEITGVSALRYDIPGQSGTVSKPTENEVLNIQKYKEALQNRICVIENRILIIDTALRGLTKIERDIIVRKIINNEKYFEFCYDLHISERYARKILRRGLQKLEELI